MTLLHSLRTECRSEWQMPQKRISICTSCSLGSRRAIVVPASGDVGPAAGEAFVFGMDWCSCWLSFGPWSGLVLFVTNLFHPVDNLTVELFLNGDMGHGRGCRGAMPVFLTGRNPDDVTRPDFLHRSASTLCPAATGGHDQGLAQWVGVPCRPGARLESYAGALNKSRIGRLKKRIDAYRAR